MILFKYYNSTSKSALICVLFSSLLLLCACHTKKQNRLSNSSSPYLQQHADNPVDWYEWGDEALAKAKKENKPLLISIGYASCHWCHQMAQESFMDTAVARIMNENFICIKVDREQRPDIDKIYMNACELISGNSGWPLNAFALPDGKPFYAGTYYSKQSWMSLLKQIATAYQVQNKKVVLQAEALSHGIAQLEFSVLSGSDTTGISKAMYQQLFENIYRKMDLKFGGWKGSPKFPAPSAIEFLLQYYFITKDKRSLDAATTTLTGMALGGIYDQAGGGFARYATDSLWRIPHFEKMLYDNAQLISLYAHAYQLTGDIFYKQVVQEMIDFVQRDLSNANGGYFSSVNADTRDGEGRFYTWASSELKASLPDTYKTIADYYHVTEKGNWKPGLNVLYTTSAPLQYIHDHKIDSSEFLKQLSTSRNVLLAVRNKRIKPSIDDKILTAWNALLIKGFLDAYAAIGNKTYLQYALSTARFMDQMQGKDGKLSRSCKDGKWSIDAFLDDYAFLAKAYLRLYQLTFDKHWLVRSQQLVDYATRNFYDAREGMYYYANTHSDSSLIQKIEIADNEIPASNSVMAEVLYELGVYFNNQDYRDKAKRMLSRLSQQLYKGETNYYTSWCFLAGLFSVGTNEVAIMGNDALARNSTLQKHYLPVSIFMGSVAEENLPVLEGKSSSSQTLIYICTKGVCKRPVQGIEPALQQLLGWQEWNN